MSDPQFLELEDVLELHTDLIARFGGSDGVRDMGLDYADLVLRVAAEGLSKSAVAEFLRAHTRRT